MDLGAGAVVATQVASRRPHMQAGSIGLPARLLALEDAWRRHGMANDGWLAAGIDSETTTRRLGELGLAAPAEIRDWFAWHNGVEAAAGGQELSLGPSGFKPLSLTEAIACREDLLDGSTAFCDEHDFDLDSRPGLERYLLPIARTTDEVPSALAAELTGATDDLVPVRVVSYWDPYYRTAGTASIAELVQAWLDILEGGATWSDADGAWHYDLTVDEAELRNLL